MYRIALAVIAAAGPACAEPDLTLGKQIYDGACAACHGPDATGDGPMAELLAIDTPDLTRIAARNGGVFPWLRIVHVVDGRTGLRGHGGAMPVFGAVFTGDAAVEDARDGTPVITSARILAVVDYLAAIQQPE